MPKFLHVFRAVELRTGGRSAIHGPPSWTPTTVQACRAQQATASVVTNSITGRAGAIQIRGPPSREESGRAAAQHF